MKPAALALATCLAVMTSWGGAGAKSFRLDRVHSDVNVRTDGTARVVESITYTFDGRFSRAFRSIPLRRGDRVDSVAVYEGGTAYEASPSTSPGHFTVERGHNAVGIVWHYRARNETRTFRVEYTVTGLATRHADAGEVYYTIFDNRTGSPVGEVSARVRVPGDLDAGAMKVFAHGPLQGTVWVVAASTVEARVAPLPNGRFFDVRIVTPPDIFAGLTPSNAPALDSIMDEEAHRAEQANRRRAAYLEGRRARAALIRELLPVSAILALLSLGMWFAYFRRYGWPHHVDVHAVPGEPPSDHPPAIVAWLASRAVTGRSMVATLVDLAERGHLRIAETRRETHGWFGSSKTTADYRFERGAGRDGLRPFERSLLEFACTKAGDGNGFTLSGFKSYASKHRSAVRRWFQSWSREVKEAGRSEGFFEPYEVGAVLPNVIVGVAVAGAGVVITAVTSSPAGIPAMVGGVLQGLLTTTFSRRTPEGQRLAVAWKGFRGHLVRVAKAMGKVSLSSRDWSRYLAIAVIFGMHEKVLPSLVMERDGHAAVYPAWYAALSGGGGQGASLSGGLSSMVSSVTSTMSSSTGAGGGASSGGGGGGGGGSAGAS